MIHLRCGDDILGKLQEAGLPGEFIKWADPLCQGPTPNTVNPATEAWRIMRAGFLSQDYGVTFEVARGDLESQHQDLLRTLEHDEVILWFEHDLYDQIILIYLLDWFSAHHPRKPRLSLICIDRFPGIGRFIGLGDLNPSQLAGLIETRHEVTPAEFKLARTAWSAYRQSNPQALLDLLQGDLSALPFLRTALIRHLHQFPSTLNGLNQTEQLALEAIASGQTEPRHIFRFHQQHENHPWLGDTMFFPYLKRMVKANQPLLCLDDQAPWPDANELPHSKIKMQLTPQGLDVLSGKADWIHLNECDRWVGGVHLQGNAVAWRWDTAQNKLVRIS